MEPFLGLTFRRTVHDKHGKLIERYDREHYSFGYSPPSRHTAHIYYELFGHRVAFHPTTLESLTGKRLVLGRTDPIDGVEYTNEVLVALPNDEVASET
jgi:hypothetical protein